MSKYRFKTEAEFKADDEWDSLSGCPMGWCSRMNVYLGQDVPSKYNKNCDVREGFDYDTWYFRYTNYVLKEKVFEIGKWYEVKWIDSTQQKTYIKPKSINLETDTLSGPSVWFNSPEGSYRFSEYYSFSKLKLIKELSPEEINPYLPDSEKIHVSKKEEPKQATSNYIGKYVKYTRGWGQIIGQGKFDSGKIDLIVINEVDGWEITPKHISDYNIDPSYKGRKGWHTHKFPSEVLDSIPDGHKIEKSIESQFKYSIGDEVQITDSSRYFSQGVINDKKMKGVVCELKDPKTFSHNYKVRWEDKTNNVYEEKDLEPYKPSVETPEEPKEKISEQPKYSRGRIEIPQIQVKKRLIF